MICVQGGAELVIEKHFIMLCRRPQLTVGHQNWDMKLRVRKDNCAVWLQILKTAWTKVRKCCVLQQRASLNLKTSDIDIQLHRTSLTLFPSLSPLFLFPNTFNISSIVHQLLLSQNWSWFNYHFGILSQMFIDLCPSIFTKNDSIYTYKRIWNSHGRIVK